MQKEAKSCSKNRILAILEHKVKRPLCGKGGHLPGESNTETGILTLFNP